MSTVEVFVCAIHTCDSRIEIPHEEDRYPAQILVSKGWAWKVSTLHSPKIYISSSWGEHSRYAHVAFCPKHARV